MNEHHIEWREDFEIGIKEVDFEHKQLIDLINTFLDHLAAQSPGSDDMLGEICVRIAAHFALEQKDMQAIHWPELPEHKEDHEALLDELLDIMQNDEVMPASELSAWLNGWFSTYFQTFDARLHRHCVQ
jgi:hemerythrin-like metal-binding protein